jgi:hypothetical protein
MIAGSMLFMTSCSKHDLSETSKNVAQMSNQERVDLVNKQTIQMVSNMSEEALRIKTLEVLATWERYKTSSNKSLEEQVYTLPEFFVFHESHINYSVSDLGLPYLEMSCQSTIESVSLIYDSENNTYALTLTDIAHIFDELDALVQSMFQEGYDHVQLVNFSLVSIDQSGNAEIGIEACVAITDPAPPPPPSPFTPADDVWAASLLGWCPTTTPTTFDAATFINVYGRSKTFRANNNCSNNFMFFILTDINTWNHPYMSGADITNHVYPNVWKGPANVCFPGGNNQYWYNLYNDFDNLEGFVTNKIRNLGFPGFSIAELLLVDYHSHDSQNNYLDDYWHGGQFWYGIVTVCN